MAHGLFDACFAGDESRAVCILRSGRDPLLNTFRQGPLQLSALHAACLSGNVTVVDMLCSCGADPRVRDVVGDTPLHTATRVHFVGAVHTLVRHGADVDATNDLGDVPLHLTVRLNVEPPTHPVHGYATLCALLQCGAALKANYQGMTPLDVACYYRNEGIMDRLLESKDFVHVEGNARTLSWLLHEESCFTSVLVRLLHHTHAVIDRFRLLVQVLMHSKLKYANTDVTLPKILALLHGPNASVVPGGLESLLIAAIDGQSAELVQTIISNDASVNAPRFDTLPLHLACLGQSLDIVQLLISHGALVNAYDAIEVNKKTPLHLATGQGHVQCMQLLLGSGAEVNLQETGTGRTPLHTAYLNRRQDQVDLLLSYGADASGRDSVGRIPLQL